jgi:hypothetical protein
LKENYKYLRFTQNGRTEVEIILCSFTVAVVFFMEFTLKNIKIE